MERLLAHPATLPLVHADHSHRASLARTGKCQKETNPSTITAWYFVKVKIDGEVTNEMHREYLLTELYCASNRPRVSAKVAQNVMNALIETASGEAKTYPGKVFSISAIQYEGYNPKPIKLADVDYGRFGLVKTFYDPKYKDYDTQDWTEAKAFLRDLLSDDYMQDKRPLFHIETR